MANLVRNNLFTLQKTASYYVMHIVVAAAVAYAVTGNLWMAITLSLIEPTVQAVAFFFHEKAWQRIGTRRRAARRAAAAPDTAVAAPAAG